MRDLSVGEILADYRARRRARSREQAGKAPVVEPPKVKKTSKYIGVTRIPAGRRGRAVDVFLARVRSGGRRTICLGYFGSAEDAALAYDHAARRIGVEKHPRLNFPEIILNRPPARYVQPSQKGKKRDRAPTGNLPVGSKPDKIDRDSR
jgi:hypothetical protein